jgi:hypothetical protein
MKPAQTIVWMLIVAVHPNYSCALFLRDMSWDQRKGLRKRYQWLVHSFSCWLTCLICKMELTVHNMWRKIPVDSYYYCLWLIKDGRRQAHRFTVKREGLFPNHRINHDGPNFVCSLLKANVLMLYDCLHLLSVPHTTFFKLLIFLATWHFCNLSEFS